MEAVGLDPTAVAAEGDLAVAGGWNESRRVGTEEMLRLLGEREADCPDERLVLVGYSMGATAVGVGLGSLSEDVVDRVDAVVFLGDPTLVAGPWLRRSGSYPVAGLLGGRRPYVPATLAARTTSWCGAGDPYCTGNVALFLLDGFVPCGPAPSEPLAAACGQRHEDYPRWAIPAAIRDVVEGLRG